MFSGGNLRGSSPVGTRIRRDATDSACAYVGNNPLNMVDPTGEDGERAAAFARQQVGSDSYEAIDTHPMVLGRRGSLLGGRLAPKCNVFVGDVLDLGGDPVQSVNGENRYPVASEWGDSSSAIEGYRPVEAYEVPMAGDIVSDGSHVGIYAPLEDGSDGTVSAAIYGAPVGTTQSDRVVHNDWGFRDGQEVTIWRHESDAMTPRNVPGPGTDPDHQRSGN